MQQKDPALLVGSFHPQLLHACLGSSQGRMNAEPSRQQRSSTLTYTTPQPETYWVKAGEDSSCSELTVVRCCLQPLSLFSPLPLSPAGRAPSPITELLPGRAVSLQLCSLAISSLCPRSPAQQQMLSPRHHLLCPSCIPQDVPGAAGLMAPEGSRVAPGAPTWKQTDAVPLSPSAHWTD